VTTRISYRAAVEWIALNDDPDERNLETIAAQISVCLLADVSGKPRTVVARAVNACRAVVRRVERRAELNAVRRMRLVGHKFQDM
jgi:cob(I)alamin adenosyltransferase